jgi:hypothetical protein
MIGNITNIDDLHAERNLLRSRLRAMELDIKDDIKAIERSVKPVIKEALAHANPAEHESGMMHQMLGLSMGMGLDLLITRVAMKNSSPVAKMMVSIVVQNGVPLLFGNGPVKFLARLRSFAHRQKSFKR